jgi:hypothetical protein
MALITRAARLGLMARIARKIRAARLGRIPCIKRATMRGRPFLIARSLRARLSLGLRTTLGMLSLLIG